MYIAQQRSDGKTVPLFVLLIVNVVHVLHIDSSLTLNDIIHAFES